MASADVKADVKQQKIKELVTKSCIFSYEGPSKLELQCAEQQVCVSHLFFLVIPANLALSIKNRAWGYFT